jgi:hypothetical protein
MNGCTIAALNFIISSRHAHRQQQTQLFMQLFNHRNDSKYWKETFDVIYEMKWENFDEYIQKFRSDREAYGKIFSLGRMNNA